MSADPEMVAVMADMGVELRAAAEALAQAILLVDVAGIEYESRADDPAPQHTAGRALAEALRARAHVDAAIDVVIAPQAPS